MEEINPSQIETSPDNYRQLATLLGVIAVDHSGVVMDPETEQRWSDVMALMQEVDDYIDHTEDSGEEIRQRLEAFNGFSSSYDSLAPSAENAIVRERLFETTDKIIKLGKEAASTESIDIYARHRIAEGFATADIFDDSASEAVRQQENFTERFLPLLRNMGAAACLLDSMTDLPKDYEQDLVLVPPTLYNRSKLFIKSIHYLKPVLPIFKHSSVQRETKTTASAYIGRRVRRLMPLKEELSGTFL